MRERGRWRANALLDQLEVQLHRRRAIRDAGEAPEHLEPARPVLPALEQVTGWSKADTAKSPHHPDRALFGGWRLEDWEGRK